MLPVTDFSDLRQSPAWASYLNSLGWKTEKVDNCQLYIKKIPFNLGSIIKVLRPSFPIPFQKIDHLARKHRAWLVKIEPRTVVDGPRLTVDDFRNHGFYPSLWPLSPSKTIQIDLRKSEKELWSGFEKRTRGSIRKGERNRLLIAQSKEIEQFCELWVKSMRKKGNLLTSGREIREIWKAFGKNIYLRLAYQPTDQTLPLAGLLMLVSDRIGYYFAAASTREANRLGAPSLLVYQAILLAKKLGCQIFDLDGIDDFRYRRATKNWEGFTRFKRGFGGEEVSFLGSFVKGAGWLRKVPFLGSGL